MASLPARACAPATLLLLLLLLPPEGQPRPPPGRAPNSRLELEAIKQSLLARLGLQRPPRVRRALSQEGLQEAGRLYRETLAQLRGNQSSPPAGLDATTRHLLRPKLKPMDGAVARSLQASDGPLGRFYSLELSRTAALRQTLGVLRAELPLLKQLLGLPQPNATTGAPMRVKVYRLAGGGGAAPARLAAPSLEAAMQQWLASPEQSLRLGLEFPAGAAALLDATLAAAKGTVTLALETRELGRVRKARQLDEECGKAGAGNCCLRTVKVSFEAIGWSDWVVAPRSYAMRFCEGSCPHNYKPASMHAQIKARLHSLSGEAPAPCCVPSAYEPMVLMHYASDGKVVTQLFDDMIVTGCHCA